MDCVRLLVEAGVVLAWMQFVMYLWFCYLSPQSINKLQLYLPVIAYHADLIFLVSMLYACIVGRAIFGAAPLHANRSGRNNGADACRSDESNRLRATACGGRGQEAHLRHCARFQNSFVPLSASIRALARISLR